MAWRRGRIGVGEGEVGRCGAVASVMRGEMEEDDDKERKDGRQT